MTTASYSTSHDTADLSALDADILAFIQSEDPDPATFDELALRLFAHQFEANPAYQRYCRSRKATPDRVRHWSEIPAVPLTAFKRLTLTTVPERDAAAVFMTSGSTDPASRGRNHHRHLALYDASLLRSFRDRFLPEQSSPLGDDSTSGAPTGYVAPDGALPQCDRMRILVLNAPREQAPHSSIAHFFSTLVEHRGTPDSLHLVSDDGLDVDTALNAFAQAEHSGKPLAVLGTSFSFVHLLDAMADVDRTFRLPAGSRVLDTGGFKGKSREVTAEDLRQAFRVRLGVPEDHCANYYGMTEISTQYYDRTPLGAVPDERAKVVPHWARMVVVDPLTRTPVPHGEPGLLLHLDLANASSCLAVLSDDIGWAVGPNPTAGTTSATSTTSTTVAAPGHHTLAHTSAGLGTADVVLRGRAAGAEARGCSLALDEVLSANHAQATAPTGS